MTGVLFELWLKVLVRWYTTDVIHTLISSQMFTKLSKYRGNNKAEEFYKRLYK